jgi:hypothetical protein
VECQEQGCNVKCKAVCAALRLCGSSAGVATRGHLALQAFITTAALLKLRAGKFVAADVWWSRLTPPLLLAPYRCRVGGSATDQPFSSAVIGPTEQGWDHFHLRDVCSYDKEKGLPVL